MRSASGRRMAGVEGRGLSCAGFTGDSGAAAVMVGFSLSGWRANSKAFTLDFASVEGWIGDFVGGTGLLVVSSVEGFLSKLRLPCHRGFDWGDLVLGHASWES
jgi:hypothetical protein